MRSAEKFNPMKSKGEPMNISAGQHTSGKVGSAKNPKGGAGKQMGPPINMGYPLKGTERDTTAGPGKFRGANTAKRTKSSKGGKM